MGDSEQPGLTLDGSVGGGQYFRSALSFSVLTGRRVEIRDVRGARENPGLKPQHVAAAEALSSIAGAEIDGVERGSRTVSFVPGEVRPGRYTVEIETAGSAPLVVDAVLPLSLVARGPVRLRVTGGTDVKWSPPLSYLRRVKLPLLREAGLLASVDVGRRGFYPVGGGDVTLSIGPSTPAPLELDESGERRGIRALSTVSEDLSDADVAERLADAALEQVDDDWTVLERTVSYVDSDATGAVIVLVAEHEAGTDPPASEAADAGFGPTCRFGTSALGEPGVPAERVGRDAVDALQEPIDAGATVDVHLADQLLPFLAVAGGAFRAPRLTEHLETHLKLLETFGAPVEWNKRDNGTVDVSAPGKLPDQW
ncbi:RNA 3'-terminal phosphate cyclase [Halalkaliarchaeum sp. AArc-GB]|uniref:RNA 3'-terminal phosphate cyclase n=1 Tax=unclassified Halalkaliarchaeum TaxID=2678344 RepID=UPI00217CDC4C|nr:MULTISPECIES: RNA 3'-terminal phosphate cyclase [unclassified Halalkaliarchaeum]MDR5671827.1 RNA 3'-terminal phosphate cyclase [Halalkaliarchaeum sp. AArc-GB]